MSDQTSSALAATRREPSNSREVRRLRRAGLVPGIVYGGGQDPVAFEIDAIVLRNALAKASTVIDLQLEGSSGPVVLKELVRHPVTGNTTHLDLLRVDLSEKIQAPVTVELVGAEDAPGVLGGGVLEHVLREVTVEALPNEVPDTITLDVTAMELGDTITLEALTAPRGVEIIGDPESAVVTVTASRAARALEELDEIETETELVGEESAEGEADAEASADADAE